MKILDILIIGFGGFLGSISRFAFNKFIPGHAFLPLGTLTVNVIGSFLVGLIVFNLKNIPYEMRIFSIIGFIGSFTTMAGVAFETYLFIVSNNFFKAGLNLFANIALSIGAIFLGKLVTKIF